MKNSFLLKNTLLYQVLRNLTFGFVASWVICKTYSNSLTQYLVNEDLPAAEISQENARGSEVVREINIYPRSEASMGNVKF